MKVAAVLEETIQVGHNYFYRSKAAYPTPLRTDKDLYQIDFVSVKNYYHSQIDVLNSLQQVFFYEDWKGTY